MTVEWWIMSKTQCLNDVHIDGEGLTKLIVGDRRVPFVEAVAVSGEETGWLAGDVWQGNEYFPCVWCSM